MNLLSGSTWKGAKLRIGEAKPDFRERCGTPHETPMWTFAKQWFILPFAGSNARTKELQTADQQKSLVWQEAFKAFTHQICLSSPQKMPLHDQVGALRPWVG